MEKDINSLSGIEFENLCQQLLQKMEFDTETTKASGDGGIDIMFNCRKIQIRYGTFLRMEAYA